MAFTTLNALDLGVFIPILFVALLGVLVACGYMSSYVLMGYCAMSAIAYSLYAWDKRAAQASRWRISERNLHLVALLGGWPGAIFAQQRLRHKSQKLSFRVIFYSTVLINVALLIAYGWRQFWAF